MSGRNFISVLSVGITVLLLSANGRGQSCPEIPNVASVCESATYTGARVLMDTSTFTETVDDCSCSFTTTADMIRIVTYAAPNYQQCNSAIRLFSSSGNAMRFQCLMSGTYLDTTAHKTGGAEFETFGQIYDKNYCLVLEHLGSDTDTITLTCYARNTTQNDTDPTTENPSIYTTQTADDIFPTTTTSAPRSTSFVPERTQSVTNTMPTYTSEPSTISNETVLTDVPSVSIVNDDTNSNNSTLTPDMGTINFEVTNGTSLNDGNISISSDNQTKHTSDISDTFASSHVLSLPNNLELVENRTSVESMTNNQTQHTSETSQTFSSSHILSLPNNITEVQNETSNNNVTTLTNNTEGSADLVEMISFDNTRDIITFPNTDDINEFTNVRNNITFDTENATNNSQKGVFTTVQTYTTEPENVEQTHTQIDNATTSTWLSDQVKTSKTTMSTDMRSTFHDDGISKEMFNDNVSPETSTSLNDIVLKDELVTNLPISNEASLPANTNKTTEYTGTSQLDSRPREESMFDSAPDQILQSTTSPVLGLNFALTNVTINNDRFTSDENARQKFGNDTSLGKTFGHNAMLNDSPVNKTNMISDSSSDKSELFGNTLHEIDPYVKAMGLINATETPESDNRATFGNDGISIENSTASLTSERKFFVDDTLSITAPANNGKTENNSSNLIVHNRSTFGPDAVPAERSTYGLDTVTWDKSTNMPNLKHTTNDSAIDGSVIETKTVNVKMETTTGAMIDEMSLLTNLKMESSLVDNLIDTQNTENSNTTSETNSNIERSTFGSDPIPIDSMSRFDPNMSLSQITAAVNNNVLEENTSRSYNESDDSKDNFRFDMANAVDNTSDTDIQSTIQGGAVTAETNKLLIGSENLVNRVGMDVLSTDDTMFRSDAMTRNQTFDFPSSERSSFGPDMVTSSNDIGSVTTETPKFGSDMVPTNDVDLIDHTNEGMKFGQDAISRDGVTSKLDRATFGPDGAVNDGITTGQKRSTLGPDVIFGDRNTIGPERATFGPDGIVSSDVTTGPERATFGPDGIVSSDVTTGPERATFGPDGIVSSDVTTGPGRATFGPDGIVSSDVTTGPGRATFGPDGIVSRDVTTGPERATFGPDGIVSSDVTTGPERATFGPDGIVSSDVTTGPERATFGPDGIVSRDVTTGPERATFGPDGIVSRDVTTGPERATFGPDGIVSSDVTTGPERATFGPDGIVSRDVTTGPGRATFGPDGIVSSDVTTGPERATFGPDGIVSNDVTTGPERATFGPDGIVSSDVTTGPERATFGPDGIVSSDVTTRPERATFGPDGIVSSDVTTRPERATFGPDGIVSSDVTTGPERATFGPDGIVSRDVTTGPERATFGPDGIVSSDVTTGPERATFGPDGILIDGMTTGSERATFGQDGIPIDGNALLPGRATFGHDNLLGDGITNGHHRNSFGQDTLLRDARVSGTVSDLLSLSNQSTVDIVSLNEVNDPSIQRDNIEQTTDRIVLGDGMVTRKIFTDGPELVSDQTLSDAAETIQTTPTPTSDDMSSDAPVTRVVFGEFVERRKLFTSTESILRDMGDTPSIPSDFVNTLNENTASAFDRRLLNDPLLQEEMTTENVSDNQNTFNDIMATMSSVVNEPIIEETLSSKADTSLLNSVQRPKQNDPGKLFNSIWNTVNEFISNSTSNDMQIAADGLNATLTGSVGNETQERMATTTQKTVTDTVTSTHGPSTDTSAELSTVIDDLSTGTTNMLIKSTNSDSLVTQADNQLTTTVAPSINETIMTETTTNMDVSTRVLTDVTTTEVREAPTTTLTLGTVVTRSTLPPIIPADREVVPVNIVRDEVASVLEPARTTQKPRRRTTKGPYDIMVDEPVLHNDRTVIDSGGVSRTDQDQLNVSLEDEPNKSLFDVNNKTYIIVVIAVAGFIILVAIVAIIIRNRRKSNEVKSKLNNGSSATNHNNAAFDASEAERGNVAPTTNGVDPPKPTVEVIEPPNADL